MQLGGFRVRPRRPCSTGGGRSTSWGERGTLALEFLIILPFLVALTWLVQWAGESGRAALLTSLTAEEAANVAVMAKLRGFSSQDALKAADDYVESRSQLWSLNGGHCINAPYNEDTREYDMSEAVGAAWWEGEGEDAESATLNRGGAGEPTQLSRDLEGEVWLEYKIDDKQVNLAIAVVRVRCHSRFRFSAPITFSTRTHESIAWEPMIAHTPIPSSRLPGP